MIWSEVDGEWKVTKMYKGASWKDIDFSYEHKTACPVCRSQNNDESGDNHHVYGNGEDGLSNGAFCFCCSTTIVSVEKALEDLENKSSTDGKVLSSNSLTKKSNIKGFNGNKEESKVSFASSKGNRDEQKLKDVAIKKTLGASEKSIVLDLTKKFLIISAIAVLISIPISYYFMNEWLKDFAYRIEMPWFPYVLSFVILLLLTFAVVSIKAYRATQVNLVKYLKYE